VGFHLKEFLKSDRMGEVGNLLTDIAGVSSGRGAVMGLIGSAAMASSEMRDGDVFAGSSNIGQMALNAMQVVNPKVAESSKFGMTQGLLQAGGYGAEAVHHRDQINGDYRNNEFWGNAGWSTLGALNAAGVKGVPKATLGIDAAGMAAGLMNKNWKFDAGEVLGAGEHAMFDGTRALGGGIGGLIGGIGGHLGGHHGGQGHGGHGPSGHGPSGHGPSGHGHGESGHGHARSHHRGAHAHHAVARHPT